MEWHIQHAICEWAEQRLRKDRSLEDKFIHVTKRSCREEIYWRSDPSHETVDKWYTTQKSCFKGYPCNAMKNLWKKLFDLFYVYSDVCDLWKYPSLVGKYEEQLISYFDNFDKWHYFFLNNIPVVCFFCTFWLLTFGIVAEKLVRFFSNLLVLIFWYSSILIHLKKKSTLTSLMSNSLLCCFMYVEMSWTVSLSS